MIYLFYTRDPKVVGGTVLENTCLKIQIMKEQNDYIDFR